MRERRLLPPAESFSQEKDQGTRVPGHSLIQSMGDKGKKEEASTAEGRNPGHCCPEKNLRVIICAEDEGGPKEENQGLLKKM